MAQGELAPLTRTGRRPYSAKPASRSKVARPFSAPRRPVSAKHARKMLRPFSANKAMRPLSAQTRPTSATTRPRPLSAPRRPEECEYLVKSSSRILSKNASRQGLALLLELKSTDKLKTGLRSPNRIMIHNKKKLRARKQARPDLAGLLPMVSSRPATANPAGIRSTRPASAKRKKKMVFGSYRGLASVPGAPPVLPSSAQHLKIPNVELQSMKFAQLRRERHAIQQARPDSSKLTVKSAQRDRRRSMQGIFPKIKSPEKVKMTERNRISGKGDTRRTKIQTATVVCISHQQSRAKTQAQP